MLGMSAFLLAVALYVAEQAMASESKLVRAIKIALTISKSGEPSNPQWDKAKAEMLALMEQGIRINPHYRKLTPMAADELASWGDWTNAIWIYESVLASRPNVVAIAANISRGYMQLGDYQKSMEYLSRARKLQPTAPAVRSVEVILLTRMGEHAQAARIVRELFAANTVDYDLVYSAYLIGIRSQDWKLAIQALMLRIDKWPSEAADGWLKLGDIYNRAEVKDEAKALESYRAALKAAPVQAKEAVWAKVPPAYKAQLPGPATP